MKKAILATVVEVKGKSPESMVVVLESEELGKANDVVATGLDCEQSRTCSESSLEVVCRGNPRAEAGDKVPVIVNCESKYPYV